MNDLAEALIYIFRKYFNFDIPDSAIPFLIFAFYIVPIVLSAALAFRHFEKYVQTAKGTLEAVTSDLRSVSERLSQKLDIIHEDVKFTREVAAAGADKEIEEDSPTESPPVRSFRYASAKQVADAVQSKWLDGTVFSSDAKDPGLFRFNGINESGERYRVVLSTPYRKAISDDGRMPFALDVWVNDRKQLNFEWDRQGTYALRGFKRGDWIEDLTSWLVRPAQLDAVHIQRQAAVA